MFFFLSSFKNLSKWYYAKTIINDLNYIKKKELSEKILLKEVLVRDPWESNSFLQDPFISTELYVTIYYCYPKD